MSANPWRLLSLPCLLLVATLGLLGCDDKIKVSDEDLKQVQYRQLRDMLENPKKPTVIVDARPKRHYDAEHIDGAINIPLPDLKPLDTALAEAHNIVVYGKTWTDYTSPAAAKTLMALGYANVFDFRGGLELWKSEGGKVIAAAKPAPGPASATPATQPAPATPAKPAAAAK